MQKVEPLWCLALITRVLHAHNPLLISAIIISLVAGMEVHTSCHFYLTRWLGRLIVEEERIFQIAVQIDSLHDRSPFGPILVGM